jgi:hypothetical protein
MAMQGHYPGHAYPAFGSGYHHHHRFLAAPAHMARYEPPPHYPSWSNHHISPTVPAAVPTYYGGSGPGSVSQPINGSPVPAAALWRVPGVSVTAPVPRQERPTPLTHARRDEMAVAWERRGQAGSASSASSASSSSQHEAVRHGGDAADNRAKVILGPTLRNSISKKNGVVRTVNWWVHAEIKIVNLFITISAVVACQCFPYFFFP